MFKANPMHLRKPKPLSASVALALGLVLPGMLVNQSYAAGEEKLEEITVTGSRIVRRDYDAASPIVTVNQDAFSQVSSMGVENVLNQLPQYTPGATQFTSGDVQASPFNTPGITTLNLRGLGANRNLVLIDGRRAQPSNAQLVVDINSIPAAAIENVEVISGGASAVYGADAMGGVTNFKLKKNYEGFNLNIQTSGTEQGGGQETTISGLIGGNFGKGNVMLGITGSERQAIKATQRDFYLEGFRDPNTTGGQALPYTSVTSSASNLVSQAALDSIFGAGKAKPQDVIYLNTDGSLFINSAASGAVNYKGPLNDEYKILGKGTANPGTLSQNNMDQLVTTPLERYAVFGRANYQINDKVNVYTQANFSHMQVDTILNYAPASSQWNVTVPRDSRALPAQLQTLLNSRPNPNASWNMERAVDFAGPRSTINTTDLFQVLAGVEGKIGDTSWTYDAFASHGKTTLVSELSGFPGTQNFRSVVNAANFGKNMNQGSGPPLFFELKCTTGLPIVASFTPSQDCINSIQTSMKHLVDVEQNILEADVQGDLWQLPAGTLQSAFGVANRTNSYRWRPDFQLTRASTNWPIGLFPTNPTTGETEVKEAYGEFLVPVLKDLPGMKSLNLELGARYSEYDTAGEIWTYKALIDWNVNDYVRIRGGYQLANRAPNAAELYTGVTTSVVGFAGGDPCLANTTNSWGNLASNPNRAKVLALCSKIMDYNGANGKSEWQTSPLYPNAIVGPFPFNFPLELANITGNSKLQNEEGKTWTMGVVVRSPFEGLLSKATLSIDWYKVQIKDAISPTDSYSVYAKCFNQDGSNPNYDLNDTCKLISRDPANGYRAAVETPYSNLGGIETSGVDVQLNWGVDAFGGLVNVNSVFNILDYYRDQLTVKDPWVDHTGTLNRGGQFDYKVLTTVSFMKDDWSVGMRHRFLPTIKDASFSNNPATKIQDADSYSLVDAFGSYEVNQQVTVRGGIDNLLDTDPVIVGRNPGVTEARGSTNAGYYDPIGRRYYISVDMKF